MCNNSSMIKKEATSDTTVPLKPPARRSRTRTRKPKFLSLKLELSPGESQSSGDTSTGRRHQLNLFPLHPENKVDDMHDENVDYLLDSGGGATLTGLLDCGVPEVISAASSEYESQQSPSLSYTHRGQRSEEAMLVRTAMKRSKERQVSEEKWVCYEEVVEKKASTAEDEVTSCSAAPSRRPVKTAPPHRSLSLKLDYQEILDAWSDKGSLYIEDHGGDQCPQTVPDLHDDDFFGSGTDKNVLLDGWGSVGNLWTVPENSGSITSSVKAEEDGGKEGWTRLGQREASVLRYKEKRQNRLFSKRIRYEVRKLNAEKRPRMKGRFVKRN